jgi:hypothetical protein
LKKEKERKNAQVNLSQRIGCALPSKLRFEKRKGEKKCSSKLGHFFSPFLFIRDPRRIRTFDLLLRRQLLYPAELWNLK